MKYFLLDHNDVILHISDTIGYQENGNTLVDNGTLAYAAILVSQVVEVASMPDGVVPMRWRYLDGEFTRNPDWVEPEQLGDDNAVIDSLLTEMEAMLDAE